MNKYCPIKDKPCNSSCAWHVDCGRCSFILSIKSIGENLKAINSKLLEPNLEEIQKTREINTAMALNNIETQKKTAALIDKCSTYINKEIARSQLELERWDT